MKKGLHITATLDQPGLLENLVEKLAGRRYDIGYGKEKMPHNYVAVETSTTETFISGTIDISDAVGEEAGNEIHLPYITQFIFTCIKEGEDSYDLKWSSSLS